jgi:hypothetical protein
MLEELYSKGICQRRVRLLLLLPPAAGCVVGNRGAGQALRLEEK